MTPITRAALVILLGIASSTQNHMAKALERQGIEVWDLIKARLTRPGRRQTGRLTPAQRRAALIYTTGLALNHTVFLYHLGVAPLGGTTALYTSMRGVGLVAMLLYTTRIMRERLTRPELAGILAILSGTLVVGLDGIARPSLDMGRINMAGALTALAAVLVLSTLLVAAGLRNGAPSSIGLAFGLSAGALGTLDPFLKTVGQTAGGGDLTPGSTAGWLVLAASFVLGEAAVLLTQWGFYRRARANVLVPALNCTYVGLPVLLQALFLPGYSLYSPTLAGLLLIMAGFVALRSQQPIAQPDPTPSHPGPSAANSDHR